MIVSTVSLFKSSSAISKKEYKRCEIEYKNFQMATLYLDFEKNLNMSNLTFELVSCESSKKNCKQQTRCNLYKRSNSSKGVSCTKEINLSMEIGSTNTLSYHVVAGDTFEFDIGKIRNLKCICKKFDFDQKLDEEFLQLGKADVKINKFCRSPKVTKTELVATPNNTSNVTKISNDKFQISVSDLCQTYHLTVRLESDPTFTNWKIKSSITFPLNIDHTNILSCQYNQTTIKIKTSAEYDSQVYYILSFGDEQCKRNVTKELTCLTKRMKIQSKTNTTAFIKLWAHGCNRCGNNEEFICYSTVSKSVKNGKISIRNTMAILCALGGLIFFIIFGIILWFKYSKTSKSLNYGKDTIRPRHTTESIAKILMKKDEDYAEENDPTYEKINECHHYDKPDISFKNIAPKIPPGRLMEERKCLFVQGNNSTILV